MPSATPTARCPNGVGARSKVHIGQTMEKAKAYVHSSTITVLELTEGAAKARLIVAILIAAIMAVGGATVYVAVRNREFRKFLAGAFFVSGGIQFYLYLAGVSVPLLGTGFVQTPALGGVRSIVHFMCFLITFYFGFIKSPRRQQP